MISPQVFSLHSLTALPLYDVWWLLVASCGYTVFVLLWSGETRHERSYNENYTPSRPLWEVKSHLAWSVVRLGDHVRSPGTVRFVLFCFVWFIDSSFFLFYDFVAIIFFCLFPGWPLLVSQPSMHSSEHYSSHRRERRFWWFECVSLSL
jgi:hypothetical protein